jgi:hypothetical protein
MVGHEHITPNGNVPPLKMLRVSHKCAVHIGIRKKMLAIPGSHSHEEQRTVAFLVHESKPLWATRNLAF